MSNLHASSYVANFGQNRNVSKIGQTESRRRVSGVEYIYALLKKSARVNDGTAPRFPAPQSHRQRYSGVLALVFISEKPTRYQRSFQSRVYSAIDGTPSSVKGRKPLTRVRSLRLSVNMGGRVFFSCFPVLEMKAPVYCWRVCLSRTELEEHTHTYLTLG
ncbi:uncharacterized protein BT62DRAFT_1011347 [Guyanagaster necrorhizus]|uniref:Uncharacterized protein n=1 Tax=Guyanagaster necrorhizus TaxID=856835 RepID=A0A9P7VJR2_9AGAR|nr:uncharacterized protein BT62DRAFT_1011347 [Guyanagaster necrorhizus MCA 3950]KAG7441762.1 hypothetical protein BT62DRAFT_1011347 [Guyanagaster necrorhizus MCA 3950]